MTSGRLSASQGKAIDGGVWHHLGASRRDLRESGAVKVVLVRSSGDVMLVGSEEDLGLEGEHEGVIAVACKGGLELEDEFDGVIVVDSAERVVRFVSFVGDSVGAGKSLGWLRVATMIVNAA